VDQDSYSGRLIDRLLLGGLLLLLSSGVCWATDPNVVAYDVSPVFEGQNLVALDVTATLHADTSGTTTLLLPDQDRGVSDLWNFVKELNVDGAQSVTEDGPAKRIVKSAAGAALTLHYRVVSAFDHDPREREIDPYKPVLCPGWFWIFGEALFVYPDIAGASAQFHWNAPRGYPFASNLEHALGRPMAMNDLIQSVLVGGPDMRLFTRQIGDASLRVAMIGQYSFSDEDFVSWTSRIVEGEREFWGGHEGPFLVTLAASAGVPHGTNASGDGRGDAFAIETTPNIATRHLESLLAHEYFHTWNPARLGGMAQGAQEPSSYWFSEGFTDFYKRRLLLRVGLYSLADFVANWNMALTEYAGSPFRLAPNSEIVTRPWDGNDMHDLPYLRGSIMAARWDRELRRKSRGRHGLDDVMLAMRADAARLGDKSPIAPDLFIEMAERFGLDVHADVENVIEQGKQALLPDNAFGQCITIATKRVPKFDSGFDLTATSRNGGTVVGLEPGGPADRAGMKEGMRIGIYGAPGNDSQKPLAYTYLKADGSEGRIVFKPEGREMTTLQQLVLAPNLSAEQQAQCKKSVAG
jgi:predicted metalloprotease with PDZ domain